MDTSMSALPDDEGEGLDGSCDFSFSQYPPVQLPLDPTRHVKQPMPGLNPFLFSCSETSIKLKECLCNLINLR